MMPTFLILFIIIISISQLNDAMEGVRFLLVPDFSKLTSDRFYSLSDKLSSRSL